MAHSQLLAPFDITTKFLLNISLSRFRKVMVMFVARVKSKTFPSFVIVQTTCWWNVFEKEKLIVLEKSGFIFLEHQENVRLKFSGYFWDRQPLNIVLEYRLCLVLLNLESDV